MEANNDNKHFDKSDALDILDRTIDFVRTFDNKASIFLGFLGVILTIIFTIGANNLISIIHSAISIRSFCSVFYLLMIIGFSIAIGVGISRMIRVIDAEIDSHAEGGLNEESKMFFEHISKNNYMCYKSKLLSAATDDFLNNIISQIYINSLVCHHKYKNYKCGLKWTFIGLCGFSIWPCLKNKICPQRDVVVR